MKSARLESPILSYKDLRVWQRSFKLVKVVYELCDQLPRDERYGLASQMKRAVVSVPSNIAEGHSRNHRKEYRQSVFVALGSLAELETQILLAKDLVLLNDSTTAPTLAELDQIRAMLLTLGRRLE